MDDIVAKPTGTPMEKVHSEGLTRFQTAEEFERHNRELADEDFRFVAGEQWPEKVRRLREVHSRPCLTINRLPTFIAQVEGDARQNKPAIKVDPVDDGADVEKAEIFEGLIRHIESDSNATTAYLTALKHSCSGGFGHWRITTDYVNNDTFDQEIKIERISNPFSVHWDPNAKEYDRADADWCFVSEMLTHEVFHERYPKFAPTDWESEFSDRDYNGWSDSNNHVRVSEYWRRVKVKKTIYELDDGRIVDKKPEGLAVRRKRDSFKFKVERYIMSGKEVLEGPEEWAGRFIPVVTITGPEDYVEGEIRFRSLVRDAKDPARMYNYWQSAITEKIALAPKSPWLVTTRQIEGLEAYWSAANVENRAYLPYNVDTKQPGAPARIHPAPIQTAEIQQSMQSIDDIKATTGLYDASRGDESNETSGRAILARQRQGNIATFAWIDNLSRGISRTGTILIDLIPKIYDSERMVRILGEDGSSELIRINEQKYRAGEGGGEGGFEFLNDLSVGKYDITVTTGPSYSTKRQESAESMMQFIQAYPAAAGVTGDLIAKNMDWPGSDDIAKRLKTLLPPQIQMMEASPEEQQMMQQQQQEPTPEQIEAQASAEKDAATTEKTRVDAEGVELDNAQKSLDLSAQTGELEEMVKGLVENILMGMAPQPQVEQVIPQYEG